MDFEISKEHEMIRKEVRRFAMNVIAPQAEEMDRNKKIPVNIIEQMGELGFIGIPFPEEYGGTGGDWVGAHICLEELARADLAVSGILDASCSLIGQELIMFGTEEQKKQWLIPLLEGKATTGFALTESNCGSDTSALETTAVLDGNEWVINGTKQFISFIAMENASMCVVAAVKGVDKKGKNIISTFIVPKDNPGMVISKNYDKMGMRAAPASELIFTDCRIPEENLLGDPDRGLAQHLIVLETGRITAAAMCVGTAQACFDESLKYAKERTQFGQPIFNYQAIQFKLADMVMSIELARNQYLKAAWLKDKGRSHTFEATVAKVYASEMLEKVSSDAVQIHGGSGYMDECPVSRYYRDARCMQILEGTSEILRMLIARSL